MTAETVPLTTKVPAGLADRAGAMAAARNLTVSKLLRMALEHELRAEGPGPVESATRERVADLAEVGPSAPRAQAAIELARRLDVDPASGSQHSRELDRLLAVLERQTQQEEASVVDILRASRTLRLSGWHVDPPTGECECPGSRPGTPARLCQKCGWEARGTSGDGAA